MTMLVPIALLLLQAAERSTPLEDPSPPAWTIVEEGACTAVRTYPNGTRVGLLWDSYSGRGTFLVTRPTWRSISDASTMPLEVGFLPYSPWTFKARGVRTSGGQGGVVATFDQRLFVTEFMQAETLVIKTGRDLIGEFPMDGSFSAAVSLGECNARMARRIKDDPFAN